MPKAHYLGDGWTVTFFDDGSALFRSNDQECIDLTRSELKRLHALMDVAYFNADDSGAQAHVIEQVD